MEQEWRSSAHARADRTPLYVAMRARADAAGCDRCHAPLALLLDPLDPAGREGVSCDVCHTLAAVRPRRSGAALVLRIDDVVRYGPLCDAKDHYFHKMGCSPLHEQSALCGGCHLYYAPSPSGAELPVYTEFEEWAEGPYRDQDLPCQHCHMPGAMAEVATGAGRRSAVPHHGLLGSGGDLRRSALRLRLVVAGGREQIRVEASLKNVGAGHKVPTGLPGRRVVLRLRALDAHSLETDRAEQNYGRVLVDAAGVEVPFYAAARLASDNRLAPEQTRVETFQLRAPGAGRVEVELAWREIGEAVAASLGLRPEEQVMLRAQVPFGPGRPGGGRSGLPRTVEPR